MGETKTPPFYDLGIFGCVQTPQNQVFLSLETPRYFKQIKKIPKHLKRNLFVNLKVSEIHVLVILIKTGTKASRISV